MTIHSANAGKPVPLALFEDKNFAQLRLVQIEHNMAEGLRHIQNAIKI